MALKMLFLSLAASLVVGLAVHPAAAEELGEEGFVDSAGVKIHYVTMGSGPLVVLIHGFPDFWYTWREQMPELAKHFQVVAVDMRGYNKSDQPEGVENYKVDKLVGDIDAVVKHFKAEKAIIVGHDWGGIVAWTYAMTHPDKTDKLVILNLPHPKGLARELANNPQQQKNSQYARNFQQPDAASKVTPEMLARWVKDSAAREKYIEAFKRFQHGRDVELLQGELSARAVRLRRESKVSPHQVPGADVSRPQGHGPAARRWRARGIGSTRT